MFQGFTPAAIDFFWGLRFHNDRDWFLAHREEFRSAVDIPFHALADELLAAMNDAHPELGLCAHVCRIYRDARRLHGRGPYKENLWLTLNRPQDDLTNTVCLYFELAANYYSYGCGYWDMTPATAARLRARIDRDPETLSALARDLANTRFRLEGEEYRRPKGSVGALLDPWYNRKNISLTYADNCEGVLFTPQLAGEVLAGFEQLLPLYRYLYSLPADPPPKTE